MSIIDINGKKTVTGGFWVWYILSISCHFVSSSIIHVADIPLWKTTAVLFGALVVVVILISFAFREKETYATVKVAHYRSRLFTYIVLVICANLIAIAPYEPVNAILGTIISVVDPFVFQILVSVVGAFSIFVVLLRYENFAEDHLDSKIK